MKKLLMLFLICCILSVMGCSKEKEQSEAVKIDFSVVSEECIPKELLEQIEAKKSEPFKLTFTDEEELYICVGYGEQKSGGYSICVLECCRLTNAVSVDTNLVGPKPDDTKKEGKSYPYIVLRMEDQKVPVVFN